MAGGAYLCFEGTEKVYEALTGNHHASDVTEITDPAELEKRQVGGAVRTDLILSAEIMAIALADLPEQTLFMQGVILAFVGIAITVGVYGVVALIVKMDDIGLHLSRREPTSVRALGRGLVKAMPVLLKALSTIGIAAMIWVGGGIILHGLETFGMGAMAHWVHDAAVAAGNLVSGARGLVEWVVGAAGSAVLGLVVGGVIVAVMHLIPKKEKAA